MATYASAIVTNAQKPSAMSKRQRRYVWRGAIMNHIEEFLRRFDPKCDICDALAYSENKQVTIKTDRGYIKVENYKIKYCPECGRRL